MSSYDKKSGDEKIKKRKRRIIHIINAVEHIKTMLFEHFLHSFSFSIPFKTKAKSQKKRLIKKSAATTTHYSIGFNKFAFVTNYKYPMHTDFVD